MKKVFVFLLLFSNLSLAGELNLTSGESAFILANNKTRVTCSGSSNVKSCSELVATFKLIMDTCFQSRSGGVCADTNWPKFKTTNPQCISEGIPVCFESCLKSRMGGPCSDLCQ